MMCLGNDLGGGKFLGIEIRSFRISAFKSEQDNFDSKCSIEIVMLIFLQLQGSLYLNFSLTFFVRTKLWRSYREDAFEEDSFCVNFVSKVQILGLGEKVRRRSIHLFNSNVLRVL